MENVSNRLLPTLSQVLAWAEVNSVSTCDSSAEKGKTTSAQHYLRAEREWTGAIAALCALLEQEICPTLLQNSSFQDSSLQDSHGDTQAEKLPHGLILSGPSSILNCSNLAAQFSTWVFTPKSLNPLEWIPFQLPPAKDKETVEVPPETTATLSLLAGDPLAAEQFCLVLTRSFSLAIVLGEIEPGKAAFQFSFDPDVVQRAWQVLRSRIFLFNPHRLGQLDELVQKFFFVTPNYRTVTQFSRLLLQHLPTPDALSVPALLTSAATHHPVPESAPPQAAAHAHRKFPTEGVSNTDLDVELLQAIAHEVRTPLATIRTLIRSLLKRKDVTPEVTKRLEMIDRECNDQIDRFGLIFHAAELQTSANKRSTMPLTPMMLEQVFSQGIPRWQKQASQRNLTLDVLLPPRMPRVVSDPTMLDQALTGLIERFTRSLPGGSHIQVEVALAGNQLKLQLQSQSEFPDETLQPPILKSLGQLLMFQPETGSLSLSLGVTKNLFQALGGKLIVRQRPQQGEVLTVFLPLEKGGPDIYTV